MTEWALTALQQSIAPKTMPSDDYYLDFDIERMQEAIGEYDENGRAIHTIEIPKGLAKDFKVFHNG